MEKEQLNFKITLSGTYWDKKPKYSVSLDGNVLVSDSVTAPSDESFTLEFNADLVEEVKHNLTISLLNKESSDTVENDDKTGIVKDMLLNIVDISIDDISLGTLLWTHSRYYANRQIYSNHVNLGWNGAWVLEFDTPFYVWLLENT